MPIDLNWFSQLRPRPGARHILVVDGGGTGSRAALADADGHVQGYAEAGPTNARAVGDDAAAANLSHLVQKALGAAGAKPELLDYCLVTSAGVDTLRHSTFLSDVVRQLGASGAEVMTVPDTIGCWAVTHDLKPAVVVISGTGSVVLAADLDSTVCRRFGGWDFLLGDEGSGFALGRAVLRETLLVGEGRSDAYELSDACLAELGLVDPSEIPDWVHKPAIHKSEIAALGQIPLRRAELGDPHAMRIVDQEIAAIARTAAAGVDAIKANEVRVGTFGGLFHSPYFQDRFTAALTSVHHRIKITAEPRTMALSGAFLLALWYCGLRGTPLRKASRRANAEISSTAQQYAAPR